MSTHYPASAADVLDDAMKFNARALAVARAFARARPWRGSRAQRIEKFDRFVAELSAAYGIARPLLRVSGTDNEDSGGSCYRPDSRTIFLCGKLSVVTLLHEFAHCLYGPSEHQACRWSINLFRRTFPKAFSRCHFDGHMVRTAVKRL